MANMTTTQIDTGAVVIQGEQFRDELLTFTGVATILAGTLLARQTDNLTVTPAAGANTGTGTCTAATVVGGAGEPVPLVGAYKLTCTTAVTNGGVWRLDDPNGQEVMTGLTMTPGAGTATVFKVGGMQFTLTDAGTDFAAADTFTLTVAAVGKIVPFAIAGAGGAQTPVGVLTYAVTSAGAGDVPIRMLVDGIVNKNRLVIDADGTGANITNAILDQLRRHGIVARDVLQTSVYDN